METRKWSQQQQDIFKWFGNDAGTVSNLVVRARAGTGKTTTIIEALAHAPEQRILLAAFNKRIATELQHKLRNPNAEAKTLHAVGYAIVRRYWERVGTDGNRGGRLARAACGQDAPDPMVKLVAKLAGIAKGCAPHAGTSKDLRTMVGLANAFDCVPDEDWEDDGWDDQRVATLAMEAMDRALTRDVDNVIDFDDMVYLPIAKGWANARYDLVVIDEAQDMNMSQIELARRVCREGGRIAVVGDDRQAIYGFRGADSGSIDRLKKELNAAEMPLTVTYRCGKNIVALAATLVPDFQAAPSNPAGAVEAVHESKLVEMAQPGDFVLSRKNAPLMGTCLSLLKAGKRAKIEGRDIGKALADIVRKLKARSIPDLIERIANWEARGIKRAQRNADTAEGKIDLIKDQAETLTAIVENLVSIKEVETRILELFTDQDDASPRIVCSTIHRAKGLEAERVFVLEDTVKRNSPDRDEANIEYVAITRAKQLLVWVKK